MLFRSVSQSRYAVTVNFVSNLGGGVLWKGGGNNPSLSLANEGDQLKFTVIEIVKGSYLVTGVHELSGIVL